MSGRRADRRRQARELSKQAADPSYNRAQFSLSLSQSNSTEIIAKSFPSAEEMRQMEGVLPGAADRFLTQWERQTSHRMEIEKMAINGDVTRAYFGLAAGFVIAIAFLYASYNLIMAGHAIVGAILGTIDLVALVSVFVYGSLMRRNERMEKAERRGQLPPKGKQ